MRYLGIDYGSVWIGLAIAEDPERIAFPRAQVRNDSKLVAYVARMIDDEDVSRVIVGDTLASGGLENPITAQAHEFAEKLQQASGAQVVFAPELWSSIEASRYAPEGAEKSDASAAAIILQRYLDMKSSRIQ
jgi:RNase H-fold protein (predicted Holliday junction resolvase)